MDGIANTGSAGSSKGKAREDSHWQLGWWETHSVLDGARRPLVWSKSSVIFSAHPSQAQVVARHFPSSKQLFIPSPAPILAAVTAYNPPTVISISPNEQWLFAYFPGTEGDGVSSLWKRGSQLDSWVVCDWWSTAKYAGVVVAEWLGADREWFVTESGLSARLPPKGPSTPVHSQTLLLVTQNHFINVCLLPPCVPSMKMLRASLLQTSNVTEANPPPTDDILGEPEGRRVCVTAAIGVDYNEPSIVVAMRSQLLPSKTVSSNSDPSMDMVFTSGLPDTNLLDDPHDEVWELLGEEPMIGLCEILLHLTFGVHWSVITKPLPSLFQQEKTLTELVFLSVPPEPTTVVLPATTKDPRLQPKEVSGGRRTHLYLAACFSECDYASTLKSQIILFSFTRNAPLSRLNIARWNTRKEIVRTFETGILAFLLPSPNKKGIIAGFLDSGGIFHRSKNSRDVVVGRVQVLTLPELSVDELWESNPIVASPTIVGRDIMSGVATSPNNALLCAMSPSSVHGAQTFIQALPKLRQQNHPGPSLSSTNNFKNDISRALCAAIYSRNSPSDLVHFLALPTTSLATTSSTLYDALSILEINSYGLPEMWSEETLGVIMEVFIGRAHNSQNSAEREAYTNQWKTLHDILSVAALCCAFEECREGDAYDLEAIWQLVGLCSWFVHRVEQLMKECVLILGTLPSPEPPIVKTEPLDELQKADVAQSLSPLATPTFLHLSHPSALYNLQEGVSHVRRFRDHLGGLSAKGENAQIAKDVLMDVVDCCGVDLKALVGFLDDALVNARKLNVDDLRRSLVIAYPTGSMIPHLHQLVEKLSTTKILDKPKLFIKPSELVDEISHLSIGDRPKEKDLDVVTKGILPKHNLGFSCVRCRGGSEIQDVGQKPNGKHTASLRWLSWERMWATGCVCGGAWMRMGN